MSMDNHSLMKTLKQIIKDSEYDQKDLADIAGVEATTMSKYLNDRTKNGMPVFVFAKVINALGLSADELFQEHGQELEVKEKAPPGPSEVLDALQVLMEAMEPAIKLMPYTVNKTEFQGPRATNTLTNSGEEYISSAFYDEETTYKAICINSQVIQNMLESWDLYKDTAGKRPDQADMIRERFFEEDIKKAKETYDGIEPLTGAFTSSDKPSAVIRYSKASVPYLLENYMFKGAEKHYHVFSKHYGNSSPDDYPDGVPIGQFDYEIPNRNRTVISTNGYTLESLDKALIANDISKLERKGSYKRKVKA